MAKDSLRKCSHCGHNGHKSRTCNNKEIKLFGVKINVAEDEYAKNQDDLRKCKSMGNLGACKEENNDDDDDGVDADADGYLSDGLIHESSKAKTYRERRKGKPWSEEEHRSFLFGLEKLGKGDWKGISKNFVYSRTPTQVASHAQKYYLRMTATEKKKRRSSVFDVPLSSEMDANSQTSPASASRTATISPPVSTTYSVKICERPPLSPMATRHAVFDLLRPQLMAGGAYNLSQSTPTCSTMPNFPVLPIWSFSNQKFNSFPNITAKYNFIPSVAQQSQGIFTMLPSYVPPQVATENKSANKDGIDLSVGALAL